MPRLLVLGKDIPRLKCVEWQDWHAHNLLDYQGLLIDCRNPSRISGNRALCDLLAQYMQHGHTVFLILPEATSVPVGGLDLSILPYLTLKLSPARGKTLKDVINSAFFQSYMTALQGHEITITPAQIVQHVPHGWAWQTTVSDNVNRAVCGQFARAYVFHAPASGRDGLAIKAILDFFQPDFEEPEREEPPEWSSRVTAQIPGVSDIRGRREQAHQEIAKLQSVIDTDAAKQRELEKWAEILWLDGVPLQVRVSEALALLGIPNESKDPTGHTQDLQGRCRDTPLLFEVTGSTGSIGIEKGRQLLQWITDCGDPTHTKGVLIGNAFRNNAPENRPPTANHKIFVKELEDMARRFHFALVDTRELFDVVIRKLGGEEVQVESVCTALRGDGVVKFAKAPRSPNATEGGS